ncbi:MAG: SRPBCC family protein [Anaerolineae bacterium]|nr:SRPBCC family protein [Anaerolineae bacterium]
MSHIARNITVHSRAEKVFDLINDPDRAGEMNPQLKLLSHSPSQIGGYDSTWEYKMAGKKFSGNTKVTEYKKPKRVVFETTGGIPSHWEWTLTSEDFMTTDVSLSLDYTVPGSLLGAIADKLVIERQNEKVIEQQLANLKRMAERN